MERRDRPIFRIMALALSLVFWMAGSERIQGATGTIIVLDLTGKSAEEKVAAYALQGLANRQGPQVFIRLKGDNRWNSFDYDAKEPLWSPTTSAAFKTKYPYIENYWIEWLIQRGYTLKESTWQELASELVHQGVLRGSILYEHLDQDLAIAATGAGVEDALPLTPLLQADPVIKGLGLPVVINVPEIRKEYSPGANPTLAAHQWVIDHLLSQCATDGAVSRVKLYNLDIHDTIVDMDRAVQHRWVVLNSLDFTSKVNPPDGPGPGSLSSRLLIDKIFAHLDKYGAVWGWGFPGENEFISSCSAHYLVGVCSGVANNSLFSSLPAPPRSFMQASQMTPETVVLEKKIYLAFAVNEGDSVKNLIALMGFGGWIQPERGTVPINWGVDPLLIRDYPALMGHIYDTATPDDYFFAATSGWGYTHPLDLPENAIKPYATLIKEGMQSSDLHYLDLWWAMSPDQLTPFIDQTGVLGWMDWTQQEQGFTWDSAGVMHLKSNLYYTLKNPTEFADRLKSDYAHTPAPWFVFVYGGTPYQFSEVARQLPADQFKIVRLDEFFAAAQKARSQIEHRVWKPLPHERPAAAP